MDRRCGGGGEAGRKEGNRLVTLSRVVFVGSSLVLHSTCGYKTSSEQVSMYVKHSGAPSFTKNSPNKSLIILKLHSVGKTLTISI